MPIRYHLVENKLDAINDTCTAVVRMLDSLGFEDIANRIVARGSTVQKADILAVLNDFGDVLETSIIEGFRVNLGDVVSLGASIRGVFEDSQDGFDPTRHTLRLVAQPGHQLRKQFLNGARVEKTEVGVLIPTPTRVFDQGSATVNVSLTPSGEAKLKGYRIGFDQSRPDEGIFFVDLDTGAETQQGEAITNRPTELVFRVPDLSAGNYDIVVRSRMGYLKEPREGNLGKNLVVQGL